MVNTVVNDFNKNYPNVQISTSHIAGAVNPADGISRGAEPTADDWETALFLAAEANVRCG